MTRRLRSNSGQALIISSLIISVLLLSTTYYVLQTRDTMKYVDGTDSSLDALRFSTINTLISALANFTNGGQREVLIEDLSRLSSSIHTYFYDDQCLLQFTPLNSSSYINGIYVFGARAGEDGMGISSSYASFVINFSGPTERYYSEYSVNITTTLAMKSTYSSVDGQRYINVTCEISNENEATLMKDVKLFYEDETDGMWRTVDSYDNLTINDFDNGTYLFSFTVQGQGSLQISASAHDLRDVMVTASVTSIQV